MINILLSFNESNKGILLLGIKTYRTRCYLSETGYISFIDAKYKAHLYNKFDQNEALKEDHRHDVHQIMAYTSFSKTDSKFGFLCYPSDKVEVKKIQFKNGINEMANTIVVFGVPLKKNAIKEVKHLLVSVLNDLEQKH